MIAVIIMPSLSWAQSFGKNKIQYDHKSWSYLQSEHFDIYFYENGEDIASFTAAVAESALVSLNKTFQFDLIARVPFLIYNSHNDFEETNVIPGLQPESVGGFTEFFKGRVVIPYEGSNEQFRHVIHHELLHAVFLQYFYGAGAGSILRGITRFQIPLWLNEGLAEYESMSWDTNADNIIRDATITGYLPPLTHLSFLAYQGGQSFYYWLERRYGKAKITELLQELRSTRNVQRAFTRTLGGDLPQISEQWQKNLKQWYWPEIERREAPTDFSTAFTDHRKTANFINNSPALSPDGSRLAYLSDRSGLFDIHLMNAITGKDMGKIISGQKQSGIEELKWLRPDITWSPDNDHIVFAAKSGWQDVLHIVDVDGKNIIRTFQLGFKGIWNPDFSPDGRHLIFSGLKNGQTDLYLLELETENVKPLTNDCFADFEPSWSPDGKWIAFVSDRNGLGGDSGLPMKPGSYGSNDIYLVRADGSGLKRLTSLPSNEKHPEFYHSSDSLVFVSDRNGIYNIYLKILSTGEDIPLTDLLVGAQQISISRGGQRLSFTSFYRGGYDIYLWRNPLAEMAKRQNSILELTDAMRYRTIPIVDEDSIKLAGINAVSTADRPFKKFIFDSDFSRGNARSSLLRTNPVEVTDDNKESNGRYKVRPYKPKFTIDYVGAASGYDPFFGLQGFGQVFLSDLTGDHQIGIGAFLNRSIANSDFQLSYGYQARRPDYFFAIGQQVNFFRSTIESNNTTITNSIERLRFFNIVTGVRYPFSRFSRVDASALYLYRTQDNLDDSDLTSFKSSAAIFNLEFTRDNTRRGLYGPDDNSRSSISLSLSPGFGSDPREFSTVKADFRKYKAFSRQWGIALRLNGGASFGKQPQRFILGGIPNWLNRNFATSLTREEVSDLTFSDFIFPLRGTDYYERIGTRFFLVNAELRFPFIQFLALQTPLPLLFQQVSGAFFVDVGSTWNDEDIKFRLFQKTDDDKTALGNDILASIGWGIRFYSPIGLLRIDAAWNTDLRNYSSPQYLFSLGTNF